MNKVQRQFVVDALEYDYLLNDWEIQFINDLAEKDEADPYYQLTDKQNTALNRITQKLNDHD